VNERRKGWHRAAVLLDGGFVVKRLQKLSGIENPSASDVLRFAHRCVHDNEELFRVYYYDCPPYEGCLTHPLTGAETNFGDSPLFHSRTKLLDELAVSNHVALRKGELKGGSWRIRRTSQWSLVKSGRTLSPRDLQPEFRQKRVDMKIGLDVAWLASKSIVDTLVLVSGDSDFVPAMKFARREGVRVVVVPMESPTFPRALREHADEVRTVHVSREDK